MRRVVQLYRNLNPVAKVACVAAATIVVHSAYVESDKFRRKVDPSFAAGTADEYISNQLSTGDVILFSRRFYQYHFPVAFAIKLRHIIDETDIDHGGVIVIREGVPYVVEHTPLNGVQVRSFEERVRRSRSAHIIVVAAERSGALAEQQKKSLETEIKRQTAQPRSLIDSEVVSVWPAFASYLLKSAAGGNEEAVKTICGDAELIGSLWRALGYEMKNERGGSGPVTLKTIHDRGVEFQPVLAVEGMPRIRLAKRDIMIRSS